MYISIDSETSRRKQGTATTYIDLGHVLLEFVSTESFQIARDYLFFPTASVL